MSSLSLSEEDITSPIHTADGNPVVTVHCCVGTGGDVELGVKVDESDRGEREIKVDKGWSVDWAE
jgi:hypothetical protein